MSHEERNTVAGIIAGILVNIWVIIRLQNLFADGRLSGDDAIKIWAQSMLWVIPVAIAFMIATTILFSIFHAIATNDAKPSFVVDERDHAISRFGMQVTMIATSVGFIGMIIALAMGVATLTVLIGVWFAFAIGSLAGDLAKLARYRRGF